MAFPLVSARYPHPSSTVSTIGFGRFAIARQNTWIYWTNHFVSVTIFHGSVPWLLKDILTWPRRKRLARLFSTTAKSFAGVPPRKLSREWLESSASTKTDFSLFIVPRAIHTIAATSLR